MRMFSLILSAILIATPAVSQDWEYGGEGVEAYALAEIGDWGLSLTCSEPNQQPKLSFYIYESLADKDEAYVPITVRVDGQAAFQSMAFARYGEGESHYDFEQSREIQEILRDGHNADVYVDGSIRSVGLRGSAEAISHVWDQC